MIFLDFLPKALPAGASGWIVIAVCGLFFLLTCGTTGYLAVSHFRKERKREQKRRDKVSDGDEL